MNKKYSCLAITLILLLSTVLITPNNLKVKASPGEDEGTVGLDYDFMYSVIENLSYIIKHPIYGTDHGIYKGRTFGTEGEIRAANLTIFHSPF